ncbi:MAG: hypothetical protein ACLP9Y_29790, partial [Mycobacterium sp.]
MRWQKEHAALMELLASPEPPEELCLQAFGETIASYTRVNELLSSERGYPTAADDFSYRLHPGSIDDDEIVFAVDVHGVPVAELLVGIGRGIEGRTGWRFLPVEPLTVTPMHSLDDEEFVALGPRCHSGVLLDWLQAMVGPQAITEVQSQAAELCLDRLRRRVEIGVSDWITMASQSEPPS